MKKVENRLVNCAESYFISALGFVEHLSQTFWITALMNVRNFKRDKLVASLFSTVWGVSFGIVDLSAPAYTYLTGTI